MATGCDELNQVVALMVLRTALVEPQERRWSLEASVQLDAFAWVRYLGT